MRAETLAALAKRLDEYGLALALDGGLAMLDGVDAATTELSHQEFGHSEVIAAIVPSMTMGALSRITQEPGVTPFVLGERVSARSADYLRRARANFLDASGNAFVRLPGLLIDVRGRTPERTHRGVPAAGGNIFSAKRSQVLFVLLSWPELVNASMRTIASCARVSIGLVAETLKLLSDAGFIENEPGDRRLRRRDELLDRWVAAFPLGLGAPSRTRQFSGDLQPLDLPPNMLAATSGEAAAPSLVGTTLTIYIDSWNPKIVFLNRWRTDGDPNIFVRSQFWRDPVGMSTAEAGTVTAPPLLVYADLMAADEGRQRDAAVELRRRDRDLFAT